MSYTQSKKELMKRALTAMTINIGKSGINDNVIEEIKRQLKDKEILKLRFSKNISSKKESYISQIIEKSNSKIIDLRGNVAVIIKKRGN
ncbi:MAG: YhbY family RNA-binding protein [Methanobacteriaceae archaeon]